MKPSIEIGSKVWICADAFVGPGVKVGDGAILGARSIVMRDVEPNTIVAGNPARQVGVRGTIQMPDRIATLNMTQRLK